MIAKHFSIASQRAAAILGAAFGLTLGAFGSAAPLSLLSPAALPGASVQQAYTQTLQASGGTPPYLWTITSGTLPPPLTLDAAAGLINGTPVMVRTNGFRLRLTDSDGAMVEQDFSLSVTQAIVGATIWSKSSGAPIRDLDGITPLAGTNFLVQLYAGTAADNLAPVGSATYFSPFLPGQFVNGTVYLPEIPPGASIWLQAKIIEPSQGWTWVSAGTNGSKRWASAIVSMPTGGLPANGPPLAPPALPPLTFAWMGPTNLTIRAQPVSRAVGWGKPASFSVDVLGLPPVKFQWQRNGVDVPGATNRVFAIPSVQTADYGEYTAMISNPVESMVSGAAALIFQDSPSIYGQPADQLLPAGQAALFEVSASGQTPLAYQWWFKDAPLADGTGPTLSLTNISADQVGNYWVVVSNAFGAETSRVAGLALVIPPAIIVSPQDLATNGGAKVTFSVTANGTAPLSYQWQKNNAPIPGATRTTLVLTNVQAIDTGLYNAVVTNAAGMAMSSNALLTVWPRSVILTNPVSVLTNLGATVTFSVAASGVGPLTYQWWNYKTPIVGATNDTLVLSNVQSADAGMYKVAVSNPGLTVFSKFASLTLILPPTVSASPQSVVANEGSTVSFGILAGGTAPLQYQWLCNGASLMDSDRISGATASVLQIARVQDSDAGSYAVQVSNSAGLTNSAPATLLVNTNRLHLANTNLIIINPQGPASPYASEVNVPTSPTIEKISVTVSNFTHAYPSDVDLLLAGPTGQKVLLLAAAGGRWAVSNLTMTFTDEATASLPRSQPLSSGTFRPTSYGPNSRQWGPGFPAPAPAAPHATTFSAFQGTDPTGPWSLYVLDTGKGDGGLIADGWRLDLTLALTNPPPGSLRVLLSPPQQIFWTVPAILSNRLISLVLSNDAPLVLPCQPLPTPVVVYQSKQPEGIGGCFNIQISSNLVHWTTVGNVQNLDGVVIFSEAEPPQGATRFYRAVLAP